MRIFNDVQQAESRNGQLRPRNWRLKEEKVPSSREHQFYGLPVTPILVTSSELKDKSRSTLTVPRVKTIFSPRDYCGTYDTASHKLLQKGNETHTHTHTHTPQRAANCYGSLIILCFSQNGATLTPVGLRSLKKFFFVEKSIFISFLAIRR